MARPDFVSSRRTKRFRVVREAPREHASSFTTELAPSPDFFEQWAKVNSGCPSIESLDPQPVHDPSSIDRPWNVLRRDQACSSVSSSL